MAKRQRDYAKEYARRIDRGIKKGLTRASARGHPRAGERPKASLGLANPNAREESAVRMMRRGSSLREAASRYRISQERLRTYLKENVQATRQGRGWQIVDTRKRTFPLYSNGRVVVPELSLSEASDAGRYMQSVRQFLETGDNTFLAPFRGKGVRDVKNKLHPFETDENLLYELDHRGEVTIPEQYKIGN